MALYEPEIYIIKEADEDLCSKLVAAQLVEVTGKNEIFIKALNLYCDFDEGLSKLSQSDKPLVYLTIYPRSFDQVIDTQASEWINWLWKAIEVIDPAYIYLDTADNSYYRYHHLTKQDAVNQTGGLLKGGKLRIPHTLMYFAKRLKKDDLIEKAKKDGFQVMSRAELGILIFTRNGDKIVFYDLGSLNFPNLLSL